MDAIKKYILHKNIYIIINISIQLFRAKNQKTINAHITFKNFA